MKIILPLLNFVSYRMKSFKVKRLSSWIKVLEYLSYILLSWCYLIAIYIKMIKYFEDATESEIYKVVMVSRKIILNKKSFTQVPKLLDLA